MRFDGKDKQARDDGATDPLITDPMATVRLQTAWEALPRMNGVPLRADLDPLALGPLIADCFVADRIAPGVARLRVTGRNLVRYTGAEPRGMPLSVLFEGADRAEITRITENCFAEPALMELPVVAPAGIGRPPLSGRLMLLPLRDGLGLVTKALGGFFISGRVGRGPRRFRIDPALPMRKMPITAAAAVAQRQADGRPALKLVVDNKI